MMGWRPLAMWVPVAGFVALAGPPVAAESPAFAGDPEYGEYLAGECTTCHQRDGGFEGIPPIIRWAPEDFVDVMNAYKSGLRVHPVMQLIAQRLSDEEIAALAAYFGGLED